MRCPQLFLLPAEELMKRHENREILEALNEVYSDAPDPSEETLREGMRRRHRQLVTEVVYWQLKRDGGKRGVFEVVGDD